MKDIPFDHKPLCRHLFIGSALVLDLINRNCNVASVHRIHNTGKARWLGNRAEISYKTSYLDNNVIDHPFVKSNFLKFICATPDFITFDENGKCEIVEVKSGETPSICESVLESVETYYQVQIALGVFQLRRARIVAMMKNNENNFDHYSCRSMITDHILFTKRKDIIKGYIVFLEDYFSKFYEVALDKDDRKVIFELLYAEVKSKRISRKFLAISDLKRKLIYDKKVEHKCLNHSIRIT